MIRFNFLSMQSFSLCNPFRYAIDYTKDNLNSLFMKLFKIINLVLFLIIGNICLSNSYIAKKAGPCIQSNGIITGTVFGESENTLPGASVVIRSLNLGVVTDLEGRFQMRNVPAGLHSLEIIYLGAVTRSIAVELKDGEVKNLGAIILKEELNELGEVIITASIEGQQRAYNQQKNSDQIKTIVSADLIGQFPDINVSEALQRVSGVNITRESGEGTNIRIRGTPSNYTTISIDGAQLPNTDGFERTEALDLIPAELLATMEITKSLLPENDGDAIGGAINLKTPTAVGGRGKLKGSVAGGYATITDRESFRSKLQYSKRFLKKKKLGVLVGTSYYTNANGEERLSGLWRPVESGTNDSGVFVTALDELQVRPTQRIRQRAGLNTTIDYKFSENSQIYLTSSYYWLNDFTERYRLRYRAQQEYPEVGNPFLAGFPNGRGRVQKDIALTDQTRQNFTVAFGGDHLINKKGKLVYGLNFSTSERNEDIFRNVFARNGVQFDIDASESDFPTYTPRGFDLSDPSVLNFLSLQEELVVVKGTNTSAFVDYEHPFRIGEKINSTLKVGGKLRLQENSRFRVNQNYGSYIGNFTMDQVVGPDQGTIFGGRYQMGPFPSISRSLRHLQQNSDLYVTNDRENIFQELSNTFDAGEDIYAAFIQDKLNIGKFSMVFGVRYELTKANYDSFFVEQRIGEVIAQPVQGGIEFDFWLPRVSMKYELNNNSNIRAGYFESFARPNFQSIIPGERVNFANLEVFRGNPSLRPAFARNFDFMYEYYFKKDGALTLGIYHKEITDYLFQQRTVIADGSSREGFLLTQDINGDKASVTGMEISIAKKLSFLPGFLSGFGVFANYTYVQSSSSLSGLSLNPDTGEQEFVTRTGVPFVGQADHTWNAALYYDKGKFSIRGSLNYNGAAFGSYDVGEFFDIIQEERYQLDVNASYNFTDKLSVFLEAQNVLDAPALEYIGSRSRLFDNRLFGAFARIGLNFKF